LVRVDVTHYRQQTERAAAVARDAEGDRMTADNRQAGHQILRRSSTGFPLFTVANNQPNGDMEGIAK